MEQADKPDKPNLQSIHCKKEHKANPKAEKQLRFEFLISKKEHEEKKKNAKNTLLPTSKAPRVPPCRVGGGGGRKAPAPLVPPRPTEMKHIWGTPQGGASWAAPPSHRAQLLPAWMEQQSDTTPAAKTKGKAKTQKVDPSPQITRSPSKKKKQTQKNPLGDVQA